MDTLEQQLKANVHQVEQRAVLNDRARAPREVEHYAYFRRYDQARAAAATLSGHGFVVTVSRRLTRSSLTASIIAPVDLETTNALTKTVFGAVAEQGGVYDGWTAVVIPD